MEQYIKPENLTNTLTIKLTDNFNLITESYARSQGTWNCTQGKIQNSQTNEIIYTFSRNYCALHYSVLQKNNQNIFQCGKTYMSQLFFNMDTKEEFDDVPKIRDSVAYHNGGALCWTKSYMADENTLAVIACPWGGSYDVYFYDFTDPHKGWFLLDSDIYITTDGCGGETVTQNQDGSFTISLITTAFSYDGEQHLTDYADFYSHYTNDIEKGKLLEDASKNSVEIIKESYTLKRVNNKIMLLEHNKHDLLKKYEEFEKKHNGTQKISIENNLLDALIHKCKENKYENMKIFINSNIKSVRISNYHDYEKYDVNKNYKIVSIRAQGKITQVNFYNPSTKFSSSWDYGNDISYLDEIMMRVTNYLNEPREIIYL